MNFDQLTNLFEQFSSLFVPVLTQYEIFKRKDDRKTVYTQGLYMSTLWYSLIINEYSRACLSSQCKSYVGAFLFVNLNHTFLQPLIQ